METIGIKGAFHEPEKDTVFKHQAPIILNSKLQTFPRPAPRARSGADAAPPADRLTE